jgi:Zn-dependent M28 family amino/carboxypeptidase
MTRPRFGLRLFEAKSILRLGVLAAVLALATFVLWLLMIWMPGQSFAGSLPPLTSLQQDLRARLRQHVETLSVTIGPRNIDHKANLDKASKFIGQELTAMGYKVERQSYSARGNTFENLSVEITGKQRPKDIVVVGAHYDSAFDSPAANDNGSGVAATLELARAYADRQPARTLRFVFFANEEPPFNWKDDMGSLVYAKGCKERQEKIIAMMSLETIGYYSDEPNSQRYPEPLDKLYPNRGNFVAFVGNLNSRELVRGAIRSFRRQNQFPSEGAALPNTLPGVGWSDHWSFWQVGYPAIMITDTAPFRYPNYHTSEDLPSKIEFDRLTQVVAGIDTVISDLTGTPI